METGNRSDGWVSQLNRFTAHHHHRSEGGSLGSRDSNASSTPRNRGWFPMVVFKLDSSRRLASVPTDCQALLQSEAPTLESSTQAAPFGLGLSFAQKYGRCKKILHYGIDSTIRLYENKAPSPSSKTKQLLAIKVYRYPISGMAPASSTQTMCSLPLSGVYSYHPNIVPILDLLYNERSELCVVMPYCAGGNLRELIYREAPLPTTEVDCLFAQILRALAFLHSHATAHLDVRLETIMLTAHCAIKLAGFGDKHIRGLWKKCAMTRGPEEDSSSLPQPHHRHWTMGSLSLSWPFFGCSSKLNSTASLPSFNRPYLPPEAFSHHSHGDIHRNHGDDNDLRPADIWAAAIVYLSLITGRVPWSAACRNSQDSRYLEYLRCRDDEDGYPPIEALGKRRRNAIYAMLHPISCERITAVDLLRSEWMDTVVVCEAGEQGI